MNRADREYFRNQKFYNRTISVWQAIGEVIGTIAIVSCFIAPFFI